MSGEKLQDIHHNEVYGTVVDNGLHGLDSSLEKGGEDGELILEVGISPEDDKRLCRKIDLCLMPFLCLISGFQYVSGRKPVENDAVLLYNVHDTDTHHSSTRFAWAMPRLWAS
jgi:hypothetical protein